MPVTQQNIHTDFDIGFTPNPLTGDISMLRDAEAVKKSVYNIVMTSIGERGFVPSYGSQVRQLLFENISPLTGVLLQRVLKEAIVTTEPRVSNVEVEIQADVDNNKYQIDIRYFVDTSEEQQTVRFFLRRLR